MKSPVYQELEVEFKEHEKACLSTRRHCDTLHA
jgi:hypothetical protein